LNLSNAGLDSLLAAEIAAWLRREAGVEISVITLMKGPSVVQLAAEVEKQRKASGSQTLAAGELSPDDPARNWSTHFRPAASPPRNAGGPLSFTEQRLARWMDHEPNRPTHCLYFPIQLSGEIDDVVLEAALRDVIARQESLRTRFVKIDGQTQREVAAEVDFTLSRRDLRELPQSEREAALRQRATDVYMTPVDPVRAPLLFVELIRTADRESVLLLQISHMIADGWSIGVLLHELQAHYNARKKGVGASVPPLLVQPFDYARWEQTALSADALEADVEKAREELVPLQFPLDRPSPDKRGPECGRVDLRIDDTLRARLTAATQQEGIPMVAAMVTAFQLALYDFTQQSTLSFSLSNANRQMQHTQELIGFFAYSYVHQAEVGPLKDEPLVLLRHNNERLNQITFADRLKILLRSDSDRILLNYINFAWEFELSGLTPRYRPDLVPKIHLWALHDLALDVVDLKEALTLTFWFTPEVLDEVTVVRFAERFSEGLKRLC
jgi:aryl carrier-like protein